MAQVRVVNVTRVALSRPGSAHHEPLRLSFLDTGWLSFPPVQRLFLYHTDRAFPSIVEELKESLSRTLPLFYSLAGRFTYVPDSGDVVISFSGDGHDGVDFLEAEAQGVEFRRLAEDEDHDVECFSSLVPALDLRELPAPVFSVQVTGFPGGAIAVGFSLHHAAADGKGVWQFVDTWATECRRAVAGGGGPIGPEPVLDRSVIRHPGAEEIFRRFLRDAAPNLPSLSNPSMPLPDRRRLARRTFVVNATSIDSLRDRGTGACRPSAFVALSAHIWPSVLKAKGVPPDDKPAALAFLADCRRHLDPPIEDCYFGNCVKACLVQAKASELLDGGSSFAKTCAAIRKAIDECLRNPLGDCDTWMETFWTLPKDSLVNIAASPRFRVYDADFGWGRPRRVELVSMNMDGEVALVGARDEDGAVQATVALSPNHMDRFAATFLGGCLQEAS